VVQIQDNQLIIPIAAFNKKHSKYNIFKDQLLSTHCKTSTSCEVTEQILRGGSTRIVDQKDSLSYEALLTFLSSRATRFLTVSCSSSGDFALDSGKLNVASVQATGPCRSST
jgi:hypothetical protein